MSNKPKNCPFKMEYEHGCAKKPIEDPETHKFLGFLACECLHECPKIWQINEGRDKTMKFRDIKSERGLEFTDISNEEYRRYLFISKNGTVASVEYHEPIGLAISASGGHRLVLASGECAYIKPEWITIHWKAKEGYHHFVK